MHYKAFSIIKFVKRDHNEPLYLTLHTRSDVIRQVWTFTDTIPLFSIKMVI